MDLPIGKREQANAKKQVVEGGQELVADMNKNLDSLPLAQCESCSQLHDAAKKFEAALKENITVDNYIKPLYSSLIERANRTTKIESATSLRDTLIKSVVFAVKGNDLLAQKLTDEEIPSIALCPAELLEMLEILPPE
ncbi:uncharacterized protein LOC108152181 isoform X2 [Drosophila miranda]|uniref:uncharacterized protein LOC108152181 isoform X2 n=1 Tax=Drosophila miranda TaxID=7229 RepID=UPI0007E8AFC6|nr:uncharacterized protein LOC108152181 isoform X2 [Drosophila miranda]